MSWNPNGIPAQSPGLRACELPWGTWDRGASTAKRLRLLEFNTKSTPLAQIRRCWPQPFQGCDSSNAFSQGSSQARNPGLEDTIPLGLSKAIRNSAPFPQAFIGRL